MSKDNSTQRPPVLEILDSEVSMNEATQKIEQTIHLHQGITLTLSYSGSIASRTSVYMDASVARLKENQK